MKCATNCGKFNFFRIFANFYALYLPEKSSRTKFHSKQKVRLQSFARNILAYMYDVLYIFRYYAQIFYYSYAASDRLTIMVSTRPSRDCWSF